MTPAGVTVPFGAMSARVLSVRTAAGPPTTGQETVADKGTLVSAARPCTCRSHGSRTWPGTGGHSLGHSTKPSQLSQPLLGGPELP